MLEEATEVFFPPGSYELDVKASSNMLANVNMLTSAVSINLGIVAPSSV